MRHGLVTRTSSLVSVAACLLRFAPVNAWLGVQVRSPGRPHDGASPCLFGHLMLRGGQSGTMAEEEVVVGGGHAISKESKEQANMVTNVKNLHT